MPKRPLKLKLRIPVYRTPRNAWRKALHRAINKVQRTSAIVYRPEDRLEVNVRLYMDSKAILRHDVDNRLKDILDALQGRAGGPKKIRTLPPIVLNDHQIYRMVIEKTLPSPQSRGLGHLIIRRLSKRRYILK